ncbi:hypothetical protein C5B94_03930 [Clavibacter michiganensis]|uniref:hypothetical protein n=1 Tax=Clavibacter michiganensis TaxID=28447 RepID=UPI000CE7D909|nr:hypothetical protein [Clavibacter michiganensis]PPF56078.1 hypothetical protein C5B94_03930 [Clavibacter michiganensis]
MTTTESFIADAIRRHPPLSFQSSVCQCGHQYREPEDLASHQASIIGVALDYANATEGTLDPVVMAEAFFALSEGRAAYPADTRSEPL